MRSSSKAIVRDGVLLCGDGDSTRILVGSNAWLDWLATNDRFVFQCDFGHFAAQREMRRDIAYWYGYRRRNKHLFKAYLGKSDGLTQAHLEAASVQLAGQSDSHPLSGGYNSDDLMTAPTSTSDDAAQSGETSSALTSVLPLIKIKPPALPDKLIERGRLTQRMKSPVTFIYAPSGFGKSTLLNEWRQMCGIPVAWVSLDADDDQPARFWFALGMALQTINPALGQAWLRQFRIADISQVVVGLANEIVRATEAPGPMRRFGLVLDDYHHIRHPDIHNSLQILLEQLPPALQLVISSRTRPPMVLGQLRAKGMVTELDTDDLRFTLEEGIEFLWRHTPGRHLSYSEMQALVKHTEGWVAGLHLATLALAQHSNRYQLMTAFNGAHTYLREYFMESALYRQPPAVQAFLFKTAILKHLTGSLCDAVTGQTDGAEMLEQLWTENLFLVRLEEPGWYRYHDLFAEMLYSQLQLQYPTEIPRLHRRAAEWYYGQSAPADAIYHLLAIQAWEEAATLIERMALRELEQTGEDSRLLRWLHQLPESVVQQHKTLLFVYVRLAVSALPYTEVEGFLARVEANITRKIADGPTDLTADEQEVLTDIRQIRYITHTGSGLNLSPSGENAATWQLLNGILRYQRLNCPELNKSAATAREVYEAARAQQNLFVILMAGGTYAIQLTFQGFLREAERIAHQVLQYVLSHRHVLPEPSSIALTALSKVCFYRNQLDQALQFLTRAGEVDPNPMSSNALIMASLERAKIESAQGHGEAALATLQAARELQARRPSAAWVDQDLVAYQSLVCLRFGDIDSARQKLAEIEESATPALYMMVRGEILLRQQQFEAAEEILNRLLRQYPHGFHHEPIMAGRVMLAQALFAQHKVNEARHIMNIAIRQAAPEGLIRPFLDYGAQSVSLITLVMHTETLPAETVAFAQETRLNPKRKWTI